MNKFKIRELKNQRRKLDKEIAKLEREEFKRINTKIMATVVENAIAKVKINNKEEEIKLHNIDIQFKRFNREVTCTIRDRRIPSIVAVGHAKCRIGESFDEKIGLSIAEYRAREQYYKLMSEHFIENL